MIVRQFKNEPEGEQLLYDRQVQQSCLHWTFFEGSFKDKKTKIYATHSESLQRIVHGCNVITPEMLHNPTEHFSTSKW